jgi:hypothetical protein
MNEKIIAKLHQLRNEAIFLTEEKDQLAQRFREIDVRLTQIAGAIVELNDLLEDLPKERIVDTEK